MNAQPSGYARHRVARIGLALLGLCLPAIAIASDRLVDATGEAAFGLPMLAIAIYGAYVTVKFLSRA